MTAFSDRKTLKLTPDGDLKMNELHRLEWAYGRQAVIQEIKVTLATIQGEDPFDPEHGVDVFSLARSNEDRAQVIFTQALMDEHGDDIQQINDMIFDTERANRATRVEINLTLANGENRGIEVQL